MAHFTADASRAVWRIADRVSTRRQERVGYLVKWKGYSEEHNSWVDEKDAE